MRQFPEIGSEYFGPALDRPCLRQLPRDLDVEPIPDMPFKKVRDFLALLINWMRHAK